MLSFDQVTIEAAHYSWLGRRSWRPLLTDISLQLAPGEIVALVGGERRGQEPVVAKRSDSAAGQSADARHHLPRWHASVRCQ